MSAGGTTPGLLFLEASLLLFATLRHEHTFRATKTNNFSQALCQSLTTSEVSEELWQSQTAGDRPRGDIPHTHTHTHTHTQLTYTVSMGNLGTETTVGLYHAADSAIPVSDRAGWL